MTKHSEPKRLAPKKVSAVRRQSDSPVDRTASDRALDVSTLVRDVKAMTRGTRKRGSK